MSFQGFEVECTDTYAFYACEVVDSAKKKKNQNDRLLINWLPEGWKPQEWVDVTRVRAAAKFSSASWRPRVGERLEVLNRAAEDEPDGWWPAKVKSTSGSQYVIAYYGWEDDQYDSHVDLCDLRPTNTSPRLKGVDIAKYRKEVPNKYVAPEDNVFTGSKNSKPHKPSLDFDRAIRILDSKTVNVASVVKECQAYTYVDVTARAFADRSRGRSFLIIGPKKSAKKAVTILKLDVEHNIRMELEREKLERDQGRIKKKEERQAKYLAMCHDTFFVPERALGFVFGPKGANIAKARAIVCGDGTFDESEVGKIDVDAPKKGDTAGNGMANIDIYAATLERVADARDLLDVQLLEKRIPSAYLGSIIGTRGANIKDIKETSEVFAIDIPQRGPGPRDEFIDITIMGTPSSIAMCESLIDRTVSQEDSLADLRKQTQETRNTLDTWDERTASALDDIDDSFADMSLASRAPTGSDPVEDFQHDLSPSPSPSPEPATTTTTENATKKKRQRRRKRG
jgi:hypothetical protein